MKNFTYENELAKLEYFRFLKGAEGCSNSSIKKYARSINHWLSFTKNDSLANFNIDSVESFKESMREASSSLKKQYDTLRYLRKFFKWLCEQKGYEKIKNSDIAYLHLSKNDTRAALERSENIFPKLSEIETLISSFHVKNEADARDRALICLLALTGMRISAAVSLPIMSFNRERIVFRQSKNIGVETKNSKNILTTFLPIGIKNAEKYFLEWFDYLIEKKQFRPQDPIFPSSSRFISGNVTRDFWASAGTARQIIEKRFSDLNLPAYNPHSFRHAAVDAISNLHLTEKEKRAISMNFGHENVGTTFEDYGYGSMSSSKAVGIVKEIRNRPKENQEKNLAELLREAADRLEK
jgi:integrase/recombinase XerD